MRQCGSRDEQPTPQALAVIAALESSQQKGLDSEDYDASRWSPRLNALETARVNADMLARFDAALTVNAMRYISDLHIGRVNPKPLKFGIDFEQKKYDLPQFLLQRVSAANDVQGALSEVKPKFNGYKRTKTALQKYLMLAAQDHVTRLPVIVKPLVSGDAYAEVVELAQRLRLLGDLPQSAVMSTESGVCGGAMVDAVKHFQARHGLGADGKLGNQTLRQLNTPLSDRVLQLEDALERWRWLPDFPRLPVAVNIPEFVLRVFSADRHVVLRMNVVVGKAVRHQTPVFAKDMKYIVFRPYWNVPLSITRAEIIPALQKDRNYLVRKDF
jgi:murein L,D-transpeptidase YcbB/YkuD